MDLTKMTLEEFLGENTEVVAGNPMTFSQMLPFISEALAGSNLRSLGEGYEIREYKAGGLGDVVLLHNDNIVGFYVGTVLAIRDDHRGKKLAVPLILEAVKNRQVPKQRGSLSHEGIKALANAWRVANGQLKDAWA